VSRSSGGGGILEEHLERRERRTIQYTEAEMWSLSWTRREEPSRSKRNKILRKYEDGLSISESGLEGRLQQRGGAAPATWQPERGSNNVSPSNRQMVRSDSN